MTKVKKRVVVVSASVVVAAAIAAAVGTTIPKTTATSANQSITPNIDVQNPEQSNDIADILSKGGSTELPESRNEIKKPAGEATVTVVRATEIAEGDSIVKFDNQIAPINAVAKNGDDEKPNPKPSENTQKDKADNPGDDEKPEDKEKPNDEQPEEAGVSDNTEIPGETGENNNEDPVIAGTEGGSEHDGFEDAKRKRLEELAVALGIAEENLDDAKAVQLLAILDENKALEEYTSAKAAVITAREDLERFVKEHEDAVEEEASYQKILDAKKAVLDAAVSEYNEVVEKNKLVSDYNNAFGTFQIAEENLEEALNKKSEAAAEVETATAEYQEAVDAKTSADLALLTAAEKKETAEQELKDAKAVKEQAVAALVAAKGNNAEAQKALQEANQAIETARGNVDAAEEKYEAAQEASIVAGVSVIDAQKAYDDACTALQEAQNAIGQGTLGFFNSNAGIEDNAAADVLNYVFEMQEEGINKGIKVNGEELEFREHMYTNLGAEKDATNLDNMRRSIKLMKELNEIRAAEGLEPLMVTDAMMAISEVQANIEYGLYVDYDQFIHNTGITSKYGVGENMAGITGETTDPFIGWYYDEKAVSDYMKEHGISNAYNAYRQMLEDGYDFGGYSVSSLGHYKNILKDYEITGMGVRYKENDIESIRKSGIATNNFAKLYGDTETVTYTVEEYEALFEAYYQKVNGDLSAAQDAVDKAKAELDAALAGETDAAEAAARLAEAETEYNNALKELSDAEENVEVKKEEAAQTQAAVDEATEIADNAETAVQEAQMILDGANTELDEATANAENAQAIFESAETAKQNAEEALTEAESDVTEKQAVADEAEEELKQAADKISDMSDEEINSAQEIVEEAKENEEVARADVDEAAKNVEDAHQKTQETESAVEAGKQIYEEAVAAETQTEEAYNKVVETREDADTEVERKKTEVDEIKESIATVEATPRMESNEIMVPVEGMPIFYDYEYNFESEVEQ